MLAIGGIGGLAIGLAGREICENLLNGVLLMTTVRWPQVQLDNKDHIATSMMRCTSAAAQMAWRALHCWKVPSQLKPQQKHWVAC